MYALPGTGDRKAMIYRLKEFTHRYNASLDSGMPLTFQEVASRVLSEENSRTKAQAMISKVKPIDHNQQEQHFAQMIAEVTRRTKKANAMSPETSHAQTNTEASKSINGTRQQDANSKEGEIDSRSHGASGKPEPAGCIDSGTPEDSREPPYGKELHNRSMEEPGDLDVL